MASLVGMFGITTRPGHARMITFLTLPVFVGATMAHIEIKALRTIVLCTWV